MGVEGAGRKKRVEQIFLHASKMMAQEGYDVDYATDMLTQCVTGDLSDSQHIMAFLGNLHRKYNNNRKGSSLAFLKNAGSKSAMKKALGQKSWDAALKSALEVLKLNPWDTAALCGVASVADAQGHGETELKCLRAALEANSKDADVNKQAALAMARRKEYDQAIACWHRVEQVKPNDEEAKREIGLLALQKQRARTESEEEAMGKLGGTPATGKSPSKSGQTELSPEDKLKKKIAEEPGEVQHYLDLAQLYLTTDRYDETEAVFAKAYEVSNNDADVRERFEDAQLTHLKLQVVAAEKQVKVLGTDEAKQDYRRLRKRLLTKEIDVYKFRCERYPANLRFKYDLGIRYQAVGEHSEAIKQFQQARNDPRYKGVCLLALGQSFLHIKQYRLAMTHFVQAITEIPERDIDNKKRALYEAGRVALAMRDKKSAGQYLSELAQLDFSYKDVSALLDKVEKLGDNEGSPGVAEEQEPPLAP